MAKIGSLEVRTVGKGKYRVKVVKFPGHEYEIEHFFPENHGGYRAKRVEFIQSEVGSKPQFVKKSCWPRRSKQLTPLSELRLARFINKLKIPSINAEEPLAAILHADGKREVVYRKIKHTTNFQLDWLEKVEKAIEMDLQKHGIYPKDIQWFYHPDGVTLIDLELYSVSDELKKKLRLKYAEPIEGY